MRIIVYIGFLLGSLYSLNTAAATPDLGDITRITQACFVSNTIQEELVSSAIDTGKYVVVLMKNGNEYKGKFLEQTEERIIIESIELGRLELIMELVERVKEIREENLHNRYSEIDTRYFFGTNGFSATKNAGYYQNTWVVVNQFNYGLTDNLSVGGGLVPSFLFGAGGLTPLWGTVKYSIPLPTDDFYWSVGTLFGTIGFQEKSGFGLLFTQATFGNKDNNINFGMGYGYVAGELAEKPTFTLSGLFRIGPKAAFITENYIINNSYESIGIISAGIRFYGKRIAIDAALASPIVEDTDVFFALPWLGISVPFGKY